MIFYAHDAPNHIMEKGFGARKRAAKRLALSELTYAERTINQSAADVFVVSVHYSETDINRLVEGPGITFRIFLGLNADYDFQVCCLPIPSAARKYSLRPLTA